jgi:hypothetical protein
MRVTPVDRATYRNRTNERTTTELFLGRDDMSAKTIISSAFLASAIATAAHADELSDIQAQAKQLREQMTKRLADLEKRQKALEAQRSVAPIINPVDALAADLPYKATVKAKPPENDDICIKGICVYGNFDMGVTYISHSTGYAGSAVAPLDTLVSRNGGAGSYFGVGGNQLSSSFIGLRGKQEIGDNLYAVFNLQTLFNPASGVTGNGVATVAQNNGLPFGSLQNAFGDSSKAGQLFNNAAYFGISSPTYGTVTIGRQNSLSSDLITNYDPLSGSNAFSVISFRARTAVAATPRTASTTTRMSIGSASDRCGWRQSPSSATAVTAAPEMPSKAISGSTIWASRRISSAARSITPLLRRR